MTNNNNNPLISIVIPIYNVEKYLDNCIRSVLKQSYKNLQIILVDDGSPDKCPEICDEYAKKHNNIEVIHKVNGGLSDARNAGIKAAVGEYIFFLDSDDTIQENSIIALVHIALDNKADIVMPSKNVKVYDDGTPSKEVDLFDESSFIHDPFDFIKKVILHRGRACRSTTIFYKAKIIKENDIEFPVGIVSEDLIFNLKYMKYAKRIDFYPQSVLNYLQRSGSITSSFHEQLGDNFLFIDKKIGEFIDSIPEPDDWKVYQDEFLCRNTIVYITSIFLKEHNLNKYQLANRYLDLKRIKSAYRVKGIAPYFNAELESIYFKIMFCLLKLNFRRCAFFLAVLLKWVKKIKP